MMITWMSVTGITMTSKHLSELEVIDRAFSYLSTNPEIIIERDGSKVSRKSNIEGDFYSDEFDVFIYERYAQVKFRDSEREVEYQLCMMPWKMSVSLNIWDDNKKAKTSVILMSEAKFTEPSGAWNEVILKEARDLMYKLYEYYNVIPCAQEE